MNPFVLLYGITENIEPSPMQTKRKIIEVLSSDEEDTSVELLSHLTKKPKTTSIHDKLLIDPSSNPTFKPIDIDQFLRNMDKATQVKNEEASHKTEFDEVQKSSSDPKNYSLNNEPLEPPKSVKIIHWNINGLGRIVMTGKLQEFFRASNPDIMCLNEIKMSEARIHDSGLISWIPPEYFYYLNCCKGKGCYGVAIITRMRPIGVRYGIGIEKHDREARVITLEFDKFNIVSCYVPYSGDKPERFLYRTKEWDPDFRAFIAGLKEKKTTIVCGDMNVAHEDLDVHNPKLPDGLSSTTPEERENFTRMIIDGFVDIFRYKFPKKQKYTFLSDFFNGRKLKKGWRLDYFLVDKASKWNVVSTDILDDVEGSDHCPIELIYKLSE